jgi:hypothetical protein
MVEAAVVLNYTILLHTIVYYSGWMPHIFPLVFSLSPRRPGFGPEPFHETIVVEKVALGKVFLESFAFSPSVSFSHCSILILILTPLLSEGQAGER